MKSNYPPGYHVYPSYGYHLEHVVDGKECWCSPKIESVDNYSGGIGYIIIHHLPN
jgi:hypothetical protein